MYHRLIVGFSGKNRKNRKAKLQRSKFFIIKIFFIIFILYYITSYYLYYMILYLLYLIFIIVHRQLCCAQYNSNYSKIMTKKKKEIGSWWLSADNKLKQSTKNLRRILLLWTILWWKWHMKYEINKCLKMHMKRTIITNTQ